MSTKLLTIIQSIRDLFSSGRGVIRLLCVSLDLVLFFWLSTKIAVENCLFYGLRQGVFARLTCTAFVNCVHPLREKNNGERKIIKLFCSKSVLVGVTVRKNVEDQKRRVRSRPIRFKMTLHYPVWKSHK